MLARLDLLLCREHPLPRRDRVVHPHPTRRPEGLDGKSARRGGALLAAGGLLALAGCGHSSRTDRAHAQAHRAAPARSLLAGTEWRMLGRLRAL
jgi:hypothetical protein